MTERIERMIVGVNPKPRVWGNDPSKSPAYEVGVQLATQDGEAEFGEYRSTEEAWEKVVARITEHVGKPFHFDAEPKKAYQGVTQWKLRNYPGKPEQKGTGGGGGSRGNTPDDRMSIEAQKATAIASALVIRANEGNTRSTSELAQDLIEITPQVVEAILDAKRQLGGSSSPGEVAAAAPKAADGREVSLAKLRESKRFSSAEELLSAVEQISGTAYPDVSDVPAEHLAELVEMLAQVPVPA